MELSCKVDYACIALLELAVRHKQKKPTSVGEIAISQKIPVRYLDQVMAMLRRSGIITSQRGAKGGYHLAREPWQIKLTDIVVALDGESSQDRNNPESITAESSPIPVIVELFIVLTSLVRWFTSPNFPNSLIDFLFSDLSIFSCFPFV